MKSLIYIAFTVIPLMAIYAFLNPKVDLKADSEEVIQFHKGTWEEALKLPKKKIN